ncbi:hypothetical protein ACHAXR_003751 [Thalassiosira sp. AJA248-18]
MAFPAYAAEVIGNILLFLLVFGMSATVDLDNILNQLQNTRALCMGAFLQFVVLPFLGFITVKMLALDNAMGLTLLVVTSSPGGSYSNWWCSIFNADLALSVTMTAISTVLAVIMLPLNLYIYVPMVFNNNDEVNVVEILDFRALMTSLLVVFSGIGLGIFASGRVTHPKFHVYANWFGSFAGVSLVMLSGIASSAIEGSGIWERDAKFYVGVAMPCVIALVLSNIMTTLSGLKKPERVTSCIECCYQNCGIATSVALTMFKGDELAEAMGVPFFYGMVELLVVGMYCIGAWKAGWTKAPPNEPFWKVVSASYEVLLAKKLAHEKDIEVELSHPYDVEVTDEYRNENKDTGVAASLYYYCHEPDLANVDPQAPSSGDLVADEKPEKQVVRDDSYVTMAGNAAGNARDLFWRSLGYKVENQDCH